MNAKPRDLQAAWGIYRASGFQATLGEINEKLLAGGFNPISDRSYRHLTKLARYGYDRYVPINQLDVETLRDPVWDTPLRHRYLARPASASVRLVFILGDLLMLEGEVVELSELELTVRVRGALPTQWLESPSKFVGTHGLVLIGDTGSARSVVVEAVRPDIGDATGSLLGLSLLEVMGPDSILGRQPLRVANIAITAHIEDAEYLLNTVRALNLLVSAVESVRIACDEALNQLDPSHAFSLPPSEIVTLRQDSPIQLDITEAVPVIVVFSWMVNFLVKQRLKWFEGDVAHGKAHAYEAQAVLQSAQAKLVSEQADLVKEFARREQLKTEALSRSLDLKRVSALIVDEVGKALTEAKGGHEVEDDIPTLGDVDTARIEKLLEHQVVPSLEKLLGPPVQELEQVTDVQIPEMDPSTAEGPAIEEAGTSDE